MTHIRPRLDDAACRGREDLYLNGRPTPGDLAAMRAICAACRDRPECLAYALEHEDRHVWAGTTSGERVKLRRQYGIELEPILIGAHVGIIHYPQHGEHEDEDRDEAQAAHPE